ncbi:MAG: sigma-54 dependent transcriptional regulator [Pseudomonadota bacterium]
MTDPAEPGTDVILIDDDPDVLAGVGQLLELADFRVETLGSGLGIEERLGSGRLGAVVSDIRMPDIDGLSLLQKVLDVDADLPVILITGHGDVPMAVEAMRRGAYDFIEKPFSSERLVGSVKKAAEKRRLTIENRRLREQLASASGIETVLRGQSPGVTALRQQILRCAGADADVLIYGETGTGKELVARCLHQFGRRSSGNFVAINCAALPENLLQSEFFGYVAGAFTGASRPRIGKFEYADGGTVFLDEIEGMPLHLQAELLRVLENRLIVRLGENKEIPLDIRVVSAAKSDLLQAVEEGTFRQDLYYRLNVLSMRIPPLRERLEDIPLLFQHFTHQTLGGGEEAPAVAPELLETLWTHDWPGNVRELQATATRHALGFPLEVDAEQIVSEEFAAGRTLDQMVTRLERHVIATALKSTDGNVERAAALVGVPKRTLYHKIKVLGVDRP